MQQFHNEEWHSDLEVNILIPKQSNALGLSGRAGSHLARAWLALPRLQSYDPSPNPDPDPNPQLQP